MVVRTAEALPLVVQAELLSLSRASLYYRPAPPSAAEVSLKHRIDELYTRHPFYGSRRITVGLQREGLGLSYSWLSRSRMAYCRRRLSSL
ncbi:MAG: hypothetical protein M3458_14775 [Acidobacteriota bacterium]|nr:hypothetical protein [Acidobacteriota bacterium]